MYRPTALGLLISTDPERAKVRILRALRAAGGNNTRAAAALGVDLATLKRWVNKLELRPQLQALRAASAEG